MCESAGVAGHVEKTRAELVALDREHADHWAREPRPTGDRVPIDGPRQTRTYAILDVPEVLFNHVAAKLQEAGYQHAFQHGGSVIDMQGIALRAEIDPLEFEIVVGDEPDEA